MNVQERILVNRLVTRIAQLPDAPKDPEVQLELDALLRLRPDATYWLAQRVLLLEQALEQAQQAQQARAAAPATGFAPAAAAAAPAATAPATAPAPSGTGSFLRNAASVGAGVLGGSLLFQGIESLLHGGNRQGLFGTGAAPVEVFETTNVFEPGTLETSLPDVGPDVLPDAGESWL